MTVKRRTRGTRIAPKRMALLVEETLKTRFEQIARASGVTGSVFFEEMIKHLETELNGRGIPEWMPQPEPNDGELPIDTA